MVDPVLMPSFYVMLCERFIQHFHTEDDINIHPYMDQLLQLRSNDSATLIIDYDDLAKYAGIYDIDKNQVSEFQTVLRLLRDEPTKARQAFRDAALGILRQIQPDYEAFISAKFRVALRNIDYEVPIDQIGQDQFLKLVQVSGLITKRQEKLLYFMEPHYRCPDKHMTIVTPSEEGLIWHKPPPHCEKRYAEEFPCKYVGRDMELDKKESITDDYQLLAVQPHHDTSEPGRARQLEIYVSGLDLVDKFMPGDFVTATGIITVDDRFQKKLGNNSLGKYIMVAWHLEKKNDELELLNDPELMEKVGNVITEESNEDEGYERLVQSICPSIYGNRIGKQSILLLLAGADTKVLRDGRRVRGNLQILFVGDPSSGKSSLAGFAKMCTVRSIEVAGKGATAPGLKAAIIWDNGVPRIEAGAYWLANGGGLVYIDEMDKTDEKVREELNEVMQDSQRITIAKASIRHDIKLDVASIHVANPKNKSVWDFNKTTHENIGFQASHLARYDLIIVFVDYPNVKEDSKKWDHMMTYLSTAAVDGDFLLGEKPNQEQQTDDQDSLPSIPQNQLLNWIELCAWSQQVRIKFHPRIIPGSHPDKILKQFCMQLRMISEQEINRRRDEAVAEEKKFERPANLITLREMPTLIRLAEASARAHHRDNVTEKDAYIAMALVSDSIATAGIDPETGAQKPPYLVNTVPTTANDPDAVRTFNPQQSRKNTAMTISQQVALMREIAMAFAREKCEECKGRRYIRIQNGEAPDFVECDNCEATGYVTGEKEFKEEEFVKTCIKEGLREEFIHTKLRVMKGQGQVYESQPGRLSINWARWNQFTQV